jgi:hypothetical protein
VSVGLTVRFPLHPYLNIIREIVYVLKVYFLKHRRERFTLKFWFLNQNQRVDFLLDRFQKDPELVRAALDNS